MLNCDQCEQWVVFNSLLNLTSVLVSGSVDDLVFYHS